MGERLLVDYADSLTRPIFPAQNCQLSEGLESFPHHYRSVGGHGYAAVYSYYLALVPDSQPTSRSPISTTSAIAQSCHARTQRVMLSRLERGWRHLDVQDTANPRACGL